MRVNTSYYNKYYNRYNRKTVRMYRYIVVLADGSRKGFEYSRKMNDTSMAESMERKGLAMVSYEYLDSYLWRE